MPTFQILQYYVFILSIFLIFSEPPPPAAPVIQEPETPIDTNPATCSIIPGRETNIEIQKGKSGLGLSIVGGADTLLVSIVQHFHTSQ